MGWSGAYIILAKVIEKDSIDTIEFKYVRKSAYNPLYRKDIASKILWKEEMRRLLSEKNVPIKSKLTRFVLINLISNNTSSLEIDKFICNCLLNRKIF